MENVRGRERVEAGQLCERKNGRGVDPNRNWAVHWGFKEKGAPRGAAGCAQARAALCSRRRPGQCWAAGACLGSRCRPGQASEGRRGSRMDTLCVPRGGGLPARAGGGACPSLCTCTLLAQFLPHAITPQGVKQRFPWPAAADYDPAEEYPGAAAFSEPEAALLLRLARALRPHVWTSVHSGMDAIFMPYDHKAEIPGAPCWPSFSISLPVCVAPLPRLPAARRSQTRRCATRLAAAPCPLLMLLAGCSLATAVQQPVELRLCMMFPAEGPGARATLEIINALNERTCSKKCATGSGGKSVGCAREQWGREVHATSARPLAAAIGKLPCRLACGVHRLRTGPQSPGQHACLLPAAWPPRCLAGWTPARRRPLRFAAWIPASIGTPRPQTTPPPNPPPPPSQLPGPRHRHRLHVAGAARAGAHDLGGVRRPAGRL